MTLEHLAQQQKLARPEPFTNAELDGAKVLRSHLPQGIPADLCTEFALARLWRAHHGNCAEAAQRLRELTAHMRAFNFDLEKASERCLGMEFAVKMFERFAISRLDEDVFSGDLLVFLQRMEGVDIKQILRAVPLGHILHSYTLLQLNFMRAMHAHEKHLGRQAAVAVVIDLRGLPFRDFINPLSASSRMCSQIHQIIPARMIVRIWSEYFSENLIRLFLVHPPALISIMWQIIKHIADQKTQAKIVLLPKGSDLLDHLDKGAVPEAYGGERRDDSGFSSPPSTCVSIPLPIHQRDHFCAQKWWERHTNGRQMPKWTEVQLRGNGEHETAKIKCEPGGTLLWMYTSNGDIHFEVVCRREGDDDGKEELPVWPKSVVASLSIPEHGSVVCTQRGTYFARFGGILGNFGWLGAGGSTKISYIVRREEGN